MRQFTHNVHQLFIGEMPFVPLWQLDTHIAVHDSVQTVPEPSRLDPLRVFQNLEEWQLGRAR